MKIESLFVYTIAYVLIGATSYAQIDPATGTGTVNGYYIGPGEDLTGANLSGANLSYANLLNSNLTSADLSGANLFSAMLNYAILTNTDISNASLLVARLENANLTEANLVDSILTSAKFTNADLSSADLSGASLTNADLSGATLIDANLTGADLSNVTLSNANLTNAILASTNLTNVYMAGVILNGIQSGNISGTPLELPSADWILSNGYLIGPYAVLSGANLSTLDLSSSDLTGVNFSGADLTGVNLSFTILAGADFTDATITDVIGNSLIDRINAQAVQLANEYTLSEIADLRPGSSLIEIIGGEALLNFKVQESTNLIYWTDTAETSTVILPAPDPGRKFFRFAGPFLQALPGFGEFQKPAFLLDSELVSSAPAFVDNIIDFLDDPFDSGVDNGYLTSGGLEILNTGNPGSSLLSEVFAFELLARAEGAILLKTESEIIYDDGSGKKADFLIQMNGHKIGVTVSRAVTFPYENPYTLGMAESLLTSKANDVILSNTNVSLGDSWVKQILVIVAYDTSYTATLQAAWGNLDPSVRSDTILYILATSGDDSFLY